MNKPRSMAKTDALVEIYKNDMTIPVHVAAKMTKCCVSYAGDVKNWIKRGCVGPVKIRYATRNIYVSRKKQGVTRELVEVSCLGCGKRFESESKYIRVCHACVGMRSGSVGSGMHDYAIM